MAPLVSVLLPTRNRLEFLRYAVETVLRQDDQDLEIVVSDNDSEDDIAGHVERLGIDHRPLPGPPRFAARPVAAANPRGAGPSADSFRHEC